MNRLLFIGLIILVGAIYLLGQSNASSNSTAYSPRPTINTYPARNTYDSYNEPDENRYGIEYFNNGDDYITSENWNCIGDCSGHKAGYEWAEDKGITDPYDCGGNSDSFIEGCEAYANEMMQEESDYEDYGNEDYFY